MIDVVLDTDIGDDCNDAAALALLLNMHKAGKCNLLAVTACTARKGATATVKAICNYYGVNVPVARYTGKPLLCDYTNNYAIDVKSKYDFADVTTDAVVLLRKTLARAKNKVVLICIGPLVNIADLLKSQGDKYSPLSGIELVREKVANFYLMAGAFDIDYLYEGEKDYEEYVERNIAHDVSSARYVAENFPVEMTYIPFEVGAEVFTKMDASVENPVWYSTLLFAKNADGATEWQNYKRPSWDVVTCLAAVEEGPMFYYSCYGVIEINEKGQTILIESDEKKHRFLTMESNLSLMESEINIWLKK